MSAKATRRASRAASRWLLMYDRTKTPPVGFYYNWRTKETRAEAPKVEDGALVVTEWDLEDLVATARDAPTREVRIEALEKLHKLSDAEENKVPMTSEDLGLLTFIVTVLKSAESSWEEKLLVGKIVWYMSRSNEAKPLIAAEPGLLDAVLQTLIEGKDKKGYKENQEPFLNVFRNLASINIRESSIALQSLGRPLLDTLSVFLEPSHEYDARMDVTITFRNLSQHLQPGFINTFISSNVHAKLLAMLNEYGPNPKTWQNRNQVPKTLMYFFEELAFHKECRQPLRDIGCMQTMEPLMSTDGGEALNAVIVMSFLDGANERSLLQQFPKSQPLLLDAFEAALDSGVGEAHDRIHKLFGYNWNFMTLKVLSGALNILAVSDTNKAILVDNPRLLPLLLRLVKGFVNNDPELSRRATNGLMLMQFIGGGGRDLVSTGAVLETLLNLSFHFESDEKLKAEYMTEDLGIAETLQALLDLPSDRDVGGEMKRHASALLKRFVPPEPSLELPAAQPFASGSASPSQAKRQHVMISYAWGANKPLVIQLAATLRSMGLDVWRDEEGSEIAPKLAGDIDACLAQAIELSHTIVICISRPYKESINCRREAQFSNSRQKAHGLNIIYVCVDPTYTSVSKPDCVDGWLGFMLGSELWYPLFSDEHVSSTASELAKIIKSKSNISSHAASPTKALLPPASPASSPASAFSPTSKSSASGSSGSGSASSPAPHAVDVHKAWKVLQDCSHMKALTDKLSDMSLDLAHDGPEYLAELEPGEVSELAALLGDTKSLKRRAFAKAMCVP